MIYCVGYTCVRDGHCGYEFFTSKGLAQRALAMWKRECAADGDIGDGTIDEAQTPKTKAEMMALLRRWGGHCDNG